MSDREIEDVELALKNVRHVIVNLPKEYANRRQQLNLLELEIMIWLTEHKDKRKPTQTKVPDRYFVELFLLRVRYCDAAFCGSSTHGTTEFLKGKIFELVGIMNAQYDAKIDPEDYLHA